MTIAKNSEATGIVMVLLGILIVIWQIYEYLRFNIWRPVSIITVLSLAKNSWAVFPQDWIGLHDILKTLPLSATLIVIGILETMG